MNNADKNSMENPCDLQKSPLSDQSEAFLKLLMNRGMLEDPEISNDTVRKAAREKKRLMYHNTELMLRYYRDINWALKCFPSNVSEDLDQPMKDLDSLLGLISAEISMDNAKLEYRLMSIQKSRLLLDRFNEALTILRQKPGNGEQMYQSLYLTYITLENLNHVKILDRLDISARHYYRIRQQAINILSIRLWAAPAGELDAWLEVLTLLEVL